jgi:hypothetical protein
MTPSSRTTRALATAVLVAAPLLLRCTEGTSGVASWNGPPFSADITNPGEPTRPPTRVYMGDGKMRMESTEPANRAALVLDPATHTVLLISDNDRMYIDAGMLAPAVAAGFAPIMHFFRPVSGGDPCAEWNTTVDQFSALIRRHQSGLPPQFTCRSLGTETVDGRLAQKWSVSSNVDSRASTVWIDQRLHVISRSMDQNGQMEMRNIHEGPQPATLFAAPSGYRKLGLTEMLATLKGKTTSSSSAGELGGAASDTGHSTSDVANQVLQRLQNAAHR